MHARTVFEESPLTTDTETATLIPDNFKVAPKAETDVGSC